MECWKQSVSNHHALYQDIVRTDHFVPATSPIVFGDAAILGGLSFFGLFDHLSKPYMNLKIAFITIFCYLYNYNSNINW